MPKRVIIADDDHEWIEILERRIRALGLEVESVTNGFDAACSILLQYPENIPDLVILDVNLPYKDGMTICEELSQLTSLVPVIMLTGRSDEEVVQHCHELRAHYVRKSSNVWPELEPLIRSLLALEDDTVASTGLRTPHGDDQSHNSVLCIDDEPMVVTALERRMTECGIEVMRAFSGMQGFWKALKQHPDAIVTDYAMPDGFATYLLFRLKNHSLTASIPVIVISGRDISGRPAKSQDHSLERQLQNQGASCVLSKPVDYPLLLERLATILPHPMKDAPALEPAHC